MPNSLSRYWLQLVFVSLTGWWKSEGSRHIGDLTVFTEQRRASVMLKLFGKRRAVSLSCSWLLPKSSALSKTVAEGNQLALQRYKTVVKRLMSWNKNVLTFSAQYRAVWKSVCPLANLISIKLCWMFWINHITWTSQCRLLYPEDQSSNLVYAHSRWVDCFHVMVTPIQNVYHLILIHINQWYASRRSCLSLKGLNRGSGLTACSTRTYLGCHWSLTKVKNIHSVHN